MARVNSMRTRSFPESFEHLFSMTNCRIGGVDRTLPPSLRFPDGGARIITPQSNLPGGLDSPPAPFQAPPQPRAMRIPLPAHVSSSSSNPLFSVSFPLLQRQEAAAIHPLEWGGRDGKASLSGPLPIPLPPSQPLRTKRARRELRARLPTLRLFSDPLLYPRRPGKQVTERDSDRVPFGPPALYFLLKEKLGEGGKGTSYSRASSFSLKFFLPSNKKTDAVWVGSKRGRVVHGRCVGVGG